MNTTQDYLLDFLKACLAKPRVQRCGHPIYGYYGVEAQCAKPQGHPGEHHQVYRDEDWAIAYDAAGFIPATNSHPVTLLERERDEARTERDALREALERLVWLKGIKERMEAGTATDADAAKYHAVKELAWSSARRALADLEEE